MESHQAYSQTRDGLCNRVDACAKKTDVSSLMVEYY